MNRYLISLFKNKYFRILVLIIGFVSMFYMSYKVTNNIKFKGLLNTYKGFRLTNHLPCHGQNTHSNGKTAKKKCEN